jgi:hypothetical protein
MEAPGICVVAVVAACWNDKGYGPWTIVNCATATVPGIRTHSGGNYTFQKAGSLVVDAAGIPKPVQFRAAIRVSFVRVVTAPTGSSATILVRLSRDSGGTWTTLETLVIADAAKTNYSEAPGDREMPYGMSWPPPFLLEEDLINFQVSGVGSTFSGADLTVEVYT